MNNSEFEIFARGCRNSLLLSASRLLGGCDEAEDVVQDALLKLYMLRDRLGGYRKPEALAHIVVKHLAINVLRERKRHPLIELKELSDVIGESDDGAERIRAVLKAIEQLPQKQQIVLRMRHLYGMESEEIAETVQMSIEAVYQNLSRARRGVLEQFKKREQR